jgi:hypothetical protein
VAHVRTGVSEDRITILGVLQVIVTANVPSSLLSILMIEAIRSSETPVLT